MPAPPTVPVIHFQSPAFGDTMLVEAHNTELGAYVELPIGTPHPDAGKWPGYILVKQQAFEGDEKWIQRFWSADPVIENTYNLARQTFSGGDITKDIYERSYMVRRKDYVPSAKLSTLSGILYVRITAGGSGYDSTTTVAFTGGGGAGATGTPIVFRGAVVGVRITAEGTGYTSNPTVAFTGIGTGATATAGGIRQNPLAQLVDEQADEMGDAPEGGVYLKVARIYEVLPGPYLPFTRWDLLLGPIQGRRRAVVNTGQAATLTATVKTTYEARNGSSIVSWEIEETNSDGTGSAGNPAYPIRDDDFYDDVRGAVQRRAQIVAGTGSEVGSLVTTSILATLTHYESQNGFLLDKVVETWVLPGPTITTSRYDPESGIKLTEARTMKQRSSITESNSLSGSTDATRILTTVEIERTNIGAALGIELVTTWPAAACYDSTTAIVEEEDRPFQYVGRLNFNNATEGPEIGDVGYGGTSYGIAISTAVHNANPAAEIVKHTIKTWFVNASTKPTLTFYEVQPRSLTFTDGFTSGTFTNVLFDAITLYSQPAATNVSIPATSPDFTTYIGLVNAATPIIIDGSVKELRRFRWKMVAISVIAK